MSSDVLGILVISDLHAHSSDPKVSSAPSYISTNSLFCTPNLNPLVKIPELVVASGLPVDWVFAPGDLGDRADPSAQKAAWQDLDRIRSKIGAQQLVGTAGNHDIDSHRTFPEFDPKGALQMLTPTFPVARECYVENDRVYSDRFWSRNFVVIPDDQHDCTLLIINSCAFHGYSSEVTAAPTEHRHGKISPLTLEAIRGAIADRSTRLNIALVHHHIQKHPWIDDGNSVMQGGDRLIEIFKETQRQWLVVHGHQHVPYLSYADDSPFAPVVLSAGSVAAKTYPVRGRHPRNQIHHISLDPSQMDPTGAEILGNVRT